MRLHERDRDEAADRHRPHASAPRIRSSKTPRGSRTAPVASHSTAPRSATAKIGRWPRPRAVLCVAPRSGALVLFSTGLESFELGLVTLLRVKPGALTLLFTLRPASRCFARRCRDCAARCHVDGVQAHHVPDRQQWIDSSVAGMLNSGMPLMIGGRCSHTTAFPRRCSVCSPGLVGILVISLPEAQVAGTNARCGARPDRPVLAPPSTCRPLQRARQPAGNQPGPRYRHAHLRAARCGRDGTQPSFVEFVRRRRRWGSAAGIAYAFAGGHGRVGAVRMSIVTYVILLVSIVLGGCSETRP